MPLSSLQKFILKESLAYKKKISAGHFLSFYKGKKNVPKKSEQVKIISRSLDRLIAKGLMVGWGEKTKCKWFIKEIKLTPGGKKQAKKLLGQQVKLPFKK